MKMGNARVLTVQDISCVGRCSLTVALPIISACGVETSVLPSAVLSTHTGVKGGTFRDLTEDMPAIGGHWAKAGVRFDYIYTGYLGSVRQMGYVREIMAGQNCVKIVDPAMADNGRLYSGFDETFVEAMKDFCKDADYVMPNLTESCLLTDTPYPESYDRAFIGLLLEKLTALGCKNIIFTGVSYEPGKTGVVVLEKGVYGYYEQVKLPISYHGTGDIYASAFVGALARGRSAYDAARIAADFCAACIRETDGSDEKWYGVRFEPVLGKLIRALEEV